MPTVSGRIVYNTATPANPVAGYYGVPGIPVVLQNIVTGATLAVLSDRQGYYSFTNVPIGTYQVVEASGYSPTVASPGNFAAAVPAPILAQGTIPPITSIPAYLIPADGSGVLHAEETVFPVQVLASDVAVHNFILTPYNIVYQGELITYELLVDNSGPYSATDVVLTNVAPPEIDPATLQYSLDNGGTWLPWTGSLDLGRIPMNAAPLPVWIRGQILGNVRGFITHTARVSSSRPDPHRRDNRDTVIAIIADVHSFSITKTSVPEVVKAGDAVTYFIHATNTSPNSTAVSAVIIDPLPAALLNGEYSTDGGITWQPWEGSYPVPAMAPGTGVTILIRATVAPGTTYDVVNTATFGGDIFDPVIAEDRTGIRRPTRDEVINEILSSIAMEELAISHILNAEGEKLQFVFGTLPGSSALATTVGDVLATNQSVRTTLDSTSQYGLLLFNKMEEALSTPEAGN